MQMPSERSPAAPSARARSAHGHHLADLSTSTARTVRQWGRSAWQGVVEIGHNSLAVLGLASIGLVLFFSSDSALRHQIERQALDWLHLRHAAAAEPEETQVDLLADLTEPEAVARATASHLNALTRQQATVATWIARRYRVAPEPIARLVQESWAIGKKANLDPTVILAIMAIESSFNPFAQSHVGAQGLMQVMTQVHDDKYEAFGGKMAAFDPVTNIRVGVQVLTECIARAGGGLEAGLKYYVGAANLPDDGGYVEKVMTEHGYLREVANGKNVPTTAPVARGGTLVASAATTAADKPATTPSSIPLVDKIISKVLPALPTQMSAVPSVPPAATASGPAAPAPLAAPAPVAAHVPAPAPAAAPTAAGVAGVAGEKPAAPAPAMASPASTGGTQATQPAPNAHGTAATAPQAAAGGQAATPKATAAPAAASAPAESEPKPAKPKAEPSAAADGRVALLGEAVR